MREVKKAILIGSCILAIWGTTLTAASSLLTTIKVKLNVNTVTFDGKNATRDTITYNGKVYVNANSVSKAYGQVTSTDKNGNINLTNQIPNVKVLKNDGKSRQTAVNIGDPVTFSFNSNSFLGLRKASGTAQLTIAELYKGNKKYIQSLGKDIDVQGEENDLYILFKVKFNLMKSTDGIELSERDFQIVSGNGKLQVLNWYPLNNSSLQFRGTIYSGSILEGYVLLTTEQTDTKPTIVFGKSVAWFKAYR